MEQIGLQVETFFKELERHKSEGMALQDAIELAAAVAGGKIAQWVAYAVSKYNEAIYERTPLFHREDQDRIALLTMGSYYEPHLYEEGYPNKEESLPEAFGDALYLVLRHPLKSHKEIERMSQLLPGSHDLRKEYLGRLKEALEVRA